MDVDTVGVAGKQLEPSGRLLLLHKQIVHLLHQIASHDAQRPRGKPYDEALHSERAMFRAIGEGRDVFQGNMRCKPWRES